jgi:hypothetical protein
MFAAGDTVTIHGHEAEIVSVHGGGKKLAVKISGAIRYVKAADAKVAS